MSVRHLYREKWLNMQRRFLKIDAERMNFQAKLILLCELNNNCLSIVNLLHRSHVVVLLFCKYVIPTTGNINVTIDKLN